MQVILSANKGWRGNPPPLVEREWEILVGESAGGIFQVREMEQIFGW